MSICGVCALRAYYRLSRLSTETKTGEFIAGKGRVVRWERQKRQNHWFDALYNDCAAARYCEARLVREAPRAPVPPSVVADPSDDDAPRFDMRTTRWSAPEFGQEQW